MALSPFLTFNLVQPEFNPVQPANARHGWIRSTCLTLASILNIFAKHPTQAVTTYLLIISSKRLNEVEQVEQTQIYQVVQTFNLAFNLFNLNKICPSIWSRHENC